MILPAPVDGAAPVPSPAYHRTRRKRRPVLRLDALTLVTRLHLLALCRLAVRLARYRCPSPLPAGRGGRPRRYSDESLLLLALLRTLWRLSYQDLHDWLKAWPALALACGLPTDAHGRPWVTSASQQCRRSVQAGAPPCESLLVVLVRLARHWRLMSGRDLIVDSAPILAWRRADPDAAVGHAPHHHARPLLLGYRVHTLLCRGSGLPLLFFLAPANAHDAPFAQPLLALAVRLYGVRPRVVRLDAGSWGLRLIAWIHLTLGAVAVVPWNAKRQKNRSQLPPTWTAEELGKRTSIERFFGRTFSLFSLFRLQRPPLAGWSAVACRVALTYAATIIVGLAAQQAGRPDLIRSPKRVLAHTWESLLE
jgi:Transposase DDE domain